MTNERKVERALVTAMQAADRSFPACGGGTKHYVRECFLPELQKLGVRIIPADSPTPSEAAAAERKRVIGEVRALCASGIAHAIKSHGERSMAELSAWEDVDAKLTELEGTK